LQQQAQMNIFGYFSATKPTSGTPCINGCVFSADRAVQWQDGKWYAELLGGMGQACTTPVPAPTQVPKTPNSPEADCIKSGGYGGTVNGTFVCLGRNTGGVPNTSTGQTNTTTTTADNGDGTSTVTTTTQTPVTECSGAGSCSTSTTTTTTTTIINNSTGAPTGPPRTTTTTGQPTESTPDGNKPCDLRAQDCGKPEEEETESAFGGACSAFNCEGDAIQCAIAREMHQNNCNLYSSHGAGVSTAEAGAAFASESDGQVTGTGRFGSTTVDASTAFNLTERAYGAGALADWSVAGMSIPLSRMNEPLSYLGYIVLIFCTLWGAQIMFAGRS
jgi:hypothetical protein